MLVELALPAKLQLDYINTLVKYFGSHSEEEIMHKFPNIDTPRNTQMCLIYIKSLMEKAGLSEVNILKINISDYLLVANEYWS